MEIVRLWVPIIVSLSAIGLSVYQGAATRRHARLSVQPRVEWRIHEDAGAGTLELSLVNVGFGPAVLSDVAVIVDGQKIAMKDLDACAEVGHRIAREHGAWDSQCFVNPDEYVLGSNDTVLVFGSKPIAAHAGEDHSGALVDYRRLGVTADYCSFYDECWQVRVE